MLRIMGMMVGCWIFSCMDLKSSLWQVKMADESRQYMCHGIKPPLYFKAPTRCLDTRLAWSPVPWMAGAIGARRREWLLIGFPTPCWVFSYSAGCTCQVNLCLHMCPGALWVATPTQFSINTRVRGTRGSDSDLDHGIKQINPSQAQLPVAVSCQPRSAWPYIWPKAMPSSLMLMY